MGHTARSRGGAQASPRAAVDSQPDQSPATDSIIHEGRLLARVRHSNVVTIYGAERIEDRIGLWMEFVKGRTLAQVVEQGKVFSAAEAVTIGIELCHAMTAVHAAGLLHRDIKANNVMLAEDGRIVLMDFGTGRELSDRSAAGLAGTHCIWRQSFFEVRRPASGATSTASGCCCITS